MEGGPTLKVKVTHYPGSSKVLNSPSSRPTSRSNAENVPSRPASPIKLSVTANSNIDSSLAFRPKAKVNSSATTRRVGVVKAATSTSSTPRSRSPTNTTPRIRNGVTSPTHMPKAPSEGAGGTLRYPTIVSAPVTPARTNSASTAASSSIAPSDYPQSRILPSLHHAVSFSSLRPTPNYSPSHKSIPAASSPQPMPSPSPRVRSKVSTVAKAVDFSTVSLAPGSSPSSLRSSSMRSLNLRTRTPSVSSMLSQQSQSTIPPPQFYPITTATKAANPHRYGPPRPPSRTILPAASQVFQPVAPETVPLGDGFPPSQHHFGVNFEDIQAKVDHSPISAPPLSPPMSAVSFSSRSSVSGSSASVSGVDNRFGSLPTTTSSHIGPPATRNGNMDINATLDGLMDYTSRLPSAAGLTGDTEDEIENKELKLRAAAKSNRKIADLEITNRSLLAINATLETTKHRQAKEIRELKRKLRESRLILPPPAYRAVKSSLDPSEIADDEEDEEEEEEDSDKKDDIYQRVTLLIDNLLNTGKRALQKEIPEGGKGGTKVLSAEEVRDWHQGAGNVDDHDPDNHEEHRDQDETVLDTQDANISMEAGEGSFTASEAEVEAMMLPSISSQTPPIFITKPSQSTLIYP